MVVVIKVNASREIQILHAAKAAINANNVAVTTSVSREPVRQKKKSKRATQATAMAVATATRVGLACRTPNAEKAAKAAATVAKPTVSVARPPNNAPQTANPTALENAPELPTDAAVRVNRMTAKAAAPQAANAHREMQTTPVESPEPNARVVRNSTPPAKAESASVARPIARANAKALPTAVVAHALRANAKAVAKKDNAKRAIRKPLAALPEASVRIVPPSKWLVALENAKPKAEPTRVVAITSPPQIALAARPIAMKNVWAKPMAAVASAGTTHVAAVARRTANVFPA
jgi:hypothetical protein